MSSPTLGLSLIVRDEADTLPRLLASIDGAFDQVALLDTGSTDRTVGIFTEWVQDQDLPLGYVLDRFEWVDDFAAARNAADDLLDTEWCCWADADDVIRAAGDLRATVAMVPAEIDCLLAPYRVPELDRLHFRKRLYRAGAARWSGRIHEDLALCEACQRHRLGRVADPIRWHHRRPSSRPESFARNGAILERWLREEPGDPRPLWMLAVRELLRGGDYRRGLDYLRRFHDLRRAELTPDAADTTAWAFEVLDALAGEPAEVRASQATPLIAIVLGRPPGAWRSGVWPCGCRGGGGASNPTSKEIAHA